MVGSWCCLFVVLAGPPSAFLLGEPLLNATALMLARQGGLHRSSGWGSARSRDRETVVTIEEGEAMLARVTAMKTRGNAVFNAKNYAEAASVYKVGRIRGGESFGADLSPWLLSLKEQISLGSELRGADSLVRVFL